MRLKTFFGLPRKVIFCKKSLISNQRPNSAIEFNTNKKQKKKLFTQIKMAFLTLGNTQDSNIELIMNTEKKNF